MWKCPNCQELIEDNFDTCWNCGTHTDGTRDPSFTRDPDTTAKQSKESLARSGIAYSSVADIALIIGQGCALIGCVCAIIFGIQCLRADNWIGALLLAPLSFFLSLANFVVFARVSRL